MEEFKLSKEPVSVDDIFSSKVMDNLVDATEYVLEKGSIDIPKVEAYEKVKGPFDITDIGLIRKTRRLLEYPLLISVRYN